MEIGCQALNISRIILLAHISENPLVEDYDIFMVCIVFLVIFLDDFCIMNGKIGHQYPVEFSVASGNIVKGARYV